MALDRFLVDCMDIKNSLGEFSFVLGLFAAGGGLRELLKIIIFLNPAQELKLRVVEKFGYLLPKTTYKERLKLLDATVVQTGLRHERFQLCGGLPSSEPGFKSRLSHFNFD